MDIDEYKSVIKGKVLMFVQSKYIELYKNLQMHSNVPFNNKFNNTRFYVSHTWLSNLISYVCVHKNCYYIYDNAKIVNLSMINININDPILQKHYYTFVDTINSLYDTYTYYFVFYEETNTNINKYWFLRFY